MKKRLLSWLMVLTLCLTLLPTAAFAAEDAPEQTQPVSEERQENAPAGEQETPAPGEEQPTSEEEPEDPASEEDGEEQPASETKRPAAAPVLLAAASGIATYSGEHTHFLCGGKDKCNEVGHTEEEQIDFTAWNETDSLPDQPGNYYLTQNVTVSYWHPVDGTVLCLNGKTITTASAISVDGQSGYAKNLTDVPSSYDRACATNFTLCDCRGGGKIIPDETTTYHNRCVVVNSGTFNLYGGSITNGYVPSGFGIDAYGGGVLVYSKCEEYTAVDENFKATERKPIPGTFNMYGGSITGGTAIYGGGVGIYVKTDYKYYDAVSFNMYGGTISGNTAGGSYEQGGGVYMYGGTFNMSGGSIANNRVSTAGCTGAGGGVYVNGGTFNMSGGSISGGGESYNIIKYGGGVYVADGAFNMSGGSISGNTASENGGGVYVAENGTFTVSGNANISGNKLGSTVAAATTANNVYLYSGKTITVGGNLQDGARIGVAGRSLDAVIAVLATDPSVTLTESDAAKFVTDKDGGYRGQLNDNKDSVVLATVTHSHCICGKADCTDTSHDSSRIFGGELWMDPSGTLWTGNKVLPVTSKNSKTYYELAASGDNYKVNYYLGSDLDLKYPLYVTRGTVKLCLNGHELKLTPANEYDVYNVITLDYTYCSGSSTSATLNLTDCKPGGKVGTVTHGEKSDNTKYTGAGVYMGKGTKFNLYDGSITGNTYGSGAGVYMYGDNAAFKMFGGSITGNKANNSRGGGVYVSGSNSTFTMSGGEITNNTAASYGGGVHMEASGTFTMTGGSITNNKAKTSGGGVCVSGSYSGKGTFTMTGGTISENAAANGGGVYVSSTNSGSGTFNVSGGSKITGNTATGNGGGVHAGENDSYYESKFTASGGVTITGNKVGSADNNVYLVSGKTITIDGTLDGAKIGVTTQDAPAPGSQIKIATDAPTGADYTGFFTPDDPGNKGYTITQKDTILYLSTHTHDWEYALSTTVTANDTITGTCKDANCTSKNGGSVTITAPDESTLTYDGSAKEASVTGAITGVTTPDITYKVKNSDNEFAALPTGEPAPTDAGTYQASITMGDKTASVKYTIAKATPKESDFTFSAGNLIYDGNPKTPRPTPIKTGMGDITVKYYQGETEVQDTTNAGTYTVKIDVTESKNYFAASNLTKDEWKFSVAKADQTITVPTGKTAVHNGKAVDISDWATVAGVDGDANTGALSYALDGSATGVTLADNKLTVETGVAVDTTFNVKVTAAGTDNYNEKTADFTVTVADKETKTLAVTQTGMTYNGGKTELVSPTYTNPEGTTATTITYTGKLRDNTEYASTAVKPTQAGTYTVTVKCETADVIYVGSAQFTIAPIDLETDGYRACVLSSQIPYIGTEETVYPYLEASSEAPQMTKNKDYEISGTTSATNVGKYTMTIRGKGNNYIGEVSGEWEIIPAPLTVTGVTAVKTYDGTTIATVTAVSFSGVKGNDTLTASDYAVTEAAYSDANAGTGKTVNGKITLNNTDTAKNYELNSGDFSVSTGEIKQATVSAKENGVLTVVNKRQKTYASELSALLPALPENCRYGEITYGGATLSLTDSIPHTTETHVNSRTGAMTLEVTNLENESTGQIGTITVPVTTTNYAVFNLTVRIDATNKIPPTGTPTLSTMEPTYGQTLSDIRFTTGKLYDDFNQKDVEGTFEWGAPDYKFTAVGDCEAGWKFTPKDGETYAEVLGTVIVTVQKATPTGTPGYTAITTGGKTLGDAALTIGSITPTGGSIAWNLGDGQTVTANTAYRWTYTPAAGDAANYTELTGSITPYVVSTGGSYTPSYPVSTPDKTENGSISSNVKNASKGDTVTITVKPEDGFRLSGLTVTDKDGNVLALTDKGDGKYTFTMPSGKVEVKATFAEEIETSPFADVATDAYYYEAVKWAADKGITEGTGNGLFGSNTPCTRAQIVTFLWRAAGSPEPKGTMADMTDVVSGSYYEKAVAWAIENGVTTGTTATTFSPDATCTRAQAVTFLARALNAKASSVAEFSDVPTDSYFAEAVAWAAANGVTEGVGNGMFAPDNDCTRAQIVTFLWRAYAGK